MDKETPLERMLRDAWREPGLRPAFYKRLLASDVLVTVLPSESQTSSGSIAAGTILKVIANVRHDGVEVIPFYTSAARLFKASPNGEQCVLMRVRELFKSRTDMHFHINPSSTWEREFSPWEVRSLLATAGIAVVEHVGVNFLRDVTLRPPNPMPERVLEALRTLYARNLEVRAAYIAERCELDGDEQGRLLIAIDLTDGGDQVRALRETGTVITESQESEIPSYGVAVLRDDRSQASRYFLENASPFYTIGLGGSIAAAPKLGKRQ